MADGSAQTIDPAFDTEETLADAERTARRTRRAEAQRGMTAVEYGLIVALLSVGILGAYIAIGDNITAAFTKLAEALA